MSYEGRKLYPIFKASFHFITLNWPAWAPLCALIVFLAPGFHSLWANTLLIPAVCFLCSGFGTAEQALWRKIITKLCIGLGINSCLISVKRFLVALLLSIFYTSPWSIPHHIAHRNCLMLAHKFCPLIPYDILLCSVTKMLTDTVVTILFFPVEKVSESLPFSFSCLP